MAAEWRGIWGPEIKNGYQCYIQWRSEINIAGNGSSVYTQTYLVKVGANGSTWNGSGSAWASATINGNTVSANFTFDARGVTSYPHFILVKEHSLWVAHNEDGTGSCWVGGELNTGTSGVGALYVNYTNVGLDFIPRASTITSVTGSVEITGANQVSVVVDKKNSAFTHVFRLGLNGIGWLYTGSSTSLSSFSYAIPKSWINSLPNNTSFTAIVGVRTYSGATQIGSEQYAYFTVTVPNTDEFKPSMTVTPTKVDNTVPSGWGIYVQGQSKLKIDLSDILGAYSSTISSKSITIDGQTVSGVNTSTVLISSSGTVNWSATLTDSRGRSKTYTGTIEVEPYSAPSITEKQSQRCLSDGTLNDEGSYLKITATGSFSSCDGNNSAEIKVSFKKTTDAEYGTKTTITSGVASVIDAELSTDFFYDIKIEITDTFNTTPIGFLDFVSSTYYAIHMKRGGKGLGFGQAATREGWVESALGINAKNGFEINGNNVDIQTGTWLPYITSSGGGTCTYSVQSGTYYKIGKVVVCDFVVRVTSRANLATGVLNIAGFPFATKDSRAWRGVIRPEGITIPSIYDNIIGYLSGTSMILMFTRGTWDNVWAAHCGTTFVLDGNLVYLTA